jgi:outer membrane protein OmpA-like peptidoglycan-associated protein
MRSIIIAVALCLAASSAFASGINHFQAATGPHNFLVSDYGGIMPHLKPTGWMVVSYMKDPLTCRDENGQEQYVIVEHQVNAEAAFAIGLFDRVELGLALPGHFLNGPAVPNNPPVLCGGFDEGGVSEVNIGDPRLTAKVLITPENKGVVASFRLVADMPLAQINANARKFTGEVLPNVRPALSAGFVDDNFKIGVDVGYLLRAPNEIGDLLVGHEITYGVGAELAVVPRVAYVTMDVFGRAGPEALFANSNQFPLEGAAGMKINVGDALITFGGGTGFVADYGAPDFRVFGGIGYLPRPEPEPEPEGPKDRDGDGILDPDDECPDAPEDFDGFEDEDGCPDVDNDKDGILDRDDDCPMEPEDRDRWEDSDGCPDPDNDKDKILDVDDECPNDPEVYNDFEDEDGCPDGEKIVVVVKRDRVEIKEKVFFAYDSDRILPKSYELLDNVGRVIRDHQEIPKILVEGHTDSDGSEEYNLDLSKRRAASVMRYLVGAGVAASRLESNGFGEGQPIDSNDTEEGKAKNRRVEFKIVEEGGEVSDSISEETEETSEEALELDEVE